MGVASGCGEQEVGVANGSEWNLWVWLVGAVVRRYIDFLILLIPYYLSLSLLIILLIPTPLVSVLFCRSIPTFCSFKKKVFRSCSSTTAADIALTEGRVALGPKEKYHDCICN